MNCRSRLPACLLAAMLVGCAGMRGGDDCPDIAGTYADPAEGSGQRLSALLLGDRRGADAARSVSVAVDGTQRQISVAAGSRRTTLKQDTDFTCDKNGVRLLAPIRNSLDLGEMLVHEVDTFHTLRKGPDGALVAARSTKEHATIAGVSMAGPERPAGELRWKELEPPAGRPRTPVTAAAPR